MTNSADPDQLASSESTLFAKTGHVVFSKRRVKKKSARGLSNDANVIYMFLFFFSDFLYKILCCGYQF